jgi:hypothetical protein
LAAAVGSLLLPVLADQHEGRQEDRLEADDQGEQPEREGVEDQALTEDPFVAQQPRSESDDVEVDEGH